MVVATCAFAACEADELALPPADCVDAVHRAIHGQDACLTVYEPVCGCDGFTYGNACEAARAGVKSWRGGSCE